MHPAMLMRIAQGAFEKLSKGKMLYEAMRGASTLEYLDIQGASTL